MAAADFARALCTCMAGAAGFATCPVHNRRHDQLRELARAQASRALLEAEGYSWFEITAARAEIARERPRGDR